jgi:hypothetical protein
VPRIRRSSAYQPHPGALPPGTHRRPPELVEDQARADEDLIAETSVQESAPEAAAPRATEPAATGTADTADTAETDTGRGPVVAETEAHGPGQIMSGPVERGETVEDQLARAAEPPRTVPALPDRLAGPPSARGARMSRRDVLVLVSVGLLAALLAFDAILWLDRRALEKALLADVLSDSNLPGELPSRGAYTRIETLTSGELEVDQWIRSLTLLDEVHVRTPSDLVLGRGISVSDLRVWADGQEVANPPVVGASRTSVSLPGSRTVHLTYRLSGVLARSVSQSEQGLVRVTSLDVSYGQRPGPAVFDFAGGQVLGLACLQTPGDASPQPCGDRVGDAWRLRVDEAAAEDIVVMARVDLSPTG